MDEIDYKMFLLKNEILYDFQHYSRFFNEQIVDYLTSLIGLEISSLKEVGFDDSIKDRLLEYEFFKKIVIYNIYMRALSLLNQEKENFSIQVSNIGGKESQLVAYGLVSEKRFPVFEFSYDVLNSKISNPIGNINLYGIVEDLVERDRMLRREISRLCSLTREDCPSCSAEEMMIWYAKQNNEIEKSKLKIRQLSGRYGLDDLEMKQASVQKYFSDVFLEDYGMLPFNFCDDNHLVNVCHDCSKGVIKRYTKNNTGVDVNRYINSV